MDELQKIKEESEPEFSIKSMFDDWEYSYGFNTEIWACYDEFMENEFVDYGYMKDILSNSQYDAYLSYRDYYNI